jgi:hypothetical protein
MRKIKTIRIDDKEITVKELRVIDIKKLFNEGKNDGIDQTLLANLSLITDLSEKIFEEMAPSELLQIWEAVKEVNSDFLELIARNMDVKIMEKIAMRILTMPFVSLSNPDIVASSGGTDIVSS